MSNPTYTIEQITKHIDLLNWWMKDVGFKPDGDDDLSTAAIMIRQLLDDHETMRRALENIRNKIPIGEGLGWVDQIIDKALDEVTK